MNISRKLSNVIRFVLDELIPPFIRDSKWFMLLPFKVLFGSKSNYFFEFKEKLHQMNTEDIAEIYRQTEDVHLARKTDLNNKCIDSILNNISGNKVLDVGCGRGYLTGLLENEYDVTGVDFVEHNQFKTLSPRTQFIKAEITRLPFDDNSFDTVICTHTLEHVREIDIALSELRRVCSERLIIVVPKQRPYKYTFDLHIHFFAHEYDFKNFVCDNSIERESYIETLEGDIFYHETISKSV